jgi:hypothetical protein
MYGSVDVGCFYLFPLAICIRIIEFGFKIGYSSAIGTNEVRPMRAVYDNSYALVVPGMGARCYKKRLTGLSAKTN